MGGSAAAPSPYQQTTVTTDLPKWKKELYGFTKDAPEYSPFKALSRHASAQARMIEGMTTRPSWSAMEQAYGVPEGTDLTPYISASRSGALTPTAPIPQRAAQGGLMSLAKTKGYAEGGLTKQEEQWLKTKQKQGEAGKLTGANKTRWENLTAKKQKATSDRASAPAVPYAQAMETKVPFFDESQMYGQYGGVTNPIYQQALDQLRAVSQAPESIGQGTGIMSDAASRLMGMAGYAPQQVSADKIEAARINRGDIRDVAAQQAQVERMTGARNVRGATMSGPQSWTQQGVAAQYMNPYTQNVLDQELFEANRQAQQRENQQRSQSAQQKAFGGTRAALQESEGRRNLGYLLSDIEAKGLQQAYGQGMQQFQQEQGLGQQAKQTNVGSLNQAALANQLYGRGGFQAQAANQAAQNLAYNNYVQQQLTAQGMNQGMDWNTASQNATMQMQAMLANQQTGLQASLANQSAGLQAQGLNLQALNQAGQLGQGIGSLGNQTWGLQQNIPQLWGAAGQTVQGIAQNWQNARQNTAQNWYGGMNQAYQPVTNMLGQTPGSTGQENVNRLPG